MALISPRDAVSVLRAGERIGPGSGFGAVELEALSQRCPERTLGAGECLFRKGAPLADVYVVWRGLVGLGRRVQGRRITLLLLRPGDIAGDDAVLLGGTALFDAFAVAEAAVLVVPAAEFLAALDLRSPFSRHWAMGLGARVSALQGRLEETLGGALRSRVAALLHHELEAGSRVVNLTQQAIADLLGVQRTSVTRVLRGLQRQGIIEIGYGHISIRDHGALATAAGVAPRTIA